MYKHQAWKAPPPRAALAAAALAATLALHGTVLGLFQQQAPQAWLLATPALERQLQGCQRQAGRAERLACTRAVVAAARRGPAVVLARQP